MPPESAPHPRDRHVLFGHGEAERALLDAVASGRLHHAWLIGGPAGIGKATFAYRAAKYLLAGGRGGDSLAVDPTANAARQVMAGSHPNLVVLDRTPHPERKTVPTAIPVDAVRRALALFAGTAADAGYRICLVDAADDLNTASANALLKVLEEPPPRSLFLLVAHAPQRLLPTIRSRCRRLALRPLADADLDGAVASLGPPWSSQPPETRARAAALAEGSVGRALAFMDPDILALVAETESLLATLPRPDWRRVMALAESVALREAAARHAQVVDTVLRHVSAEIDRRQAEGPARLAGWVEVCEKLNRSAREADVYNLDRRPLVLSLFDDLAAVAGV